MLRMQGVSKIYRTKFVETHALEQFSIHAHKGEFIALMGPSGSGKSTFLNVAGLLDEFESGSYWLDGVDVASLGDGQRSRIRNHKIGFIFQSYNLIPELDVFDNIDVPLRYRGLAGPRRKELIEKALTTVGLSGRMQHYPAQLSGGQQQRVAIARALAGGPPLLLADEPTGNLDTEMAEQIMELLAAINADGTTIVMVTHDLDLARRAHRIVHIRDGRSVDEAALAAVARNV
ncbi:MAG: ABC transporter ATP-binding protein [Planctomycetes bacterium]|nr:ABC transporter ATP-binding protein [Planctomycetota bacterium]